MRRPASSPPELPGYTFVRLLGTGGFSDVFLYEQKLPKRRVAVKVLLTEEVTGANRSAFVAEANLMAQLSAHPYIVTIYHADVADDDRPYFVMEYCSGPSLAERYKRETFPVADALRTGVRLASAIATAHGAGILHRDIKPANVLTNDFGWPALTDFGISSAVDEDVLPIHTGTLADALHDTGSTGSQSIGMSVPWSPPEMFEDDPNPDVRSDVFSLAATVYTILAGQTPFEVRGRSNGTLDLIGRIERGAITPISRDDLPRSLVAVLAKGMASDRADRFQTAVDFARALQRVELELGYSPTTIDVPNLLVEAPERDGEQDDADATRARSVATVEAQPIVQRPASIITPPASAFSPQPSGASADETQLRGARRVDAQPVTAAPTAGSGTRNQPAADSELPAETIVRKRTVTQPEPVAEAAPAEPVARTSKANRIIIWVGGGVAVVVAAAIALSIALSGAPSDGAAKPTAPTHGDDSAVVDTVPAPTLASKILNGSSVIFTVANPKPKKGDAFVWKISGRGDSEPMKAAAANTIEVDGYTPGSMVCVSVAVRRSGQVGDPLEACYPK